MCMTTIDTLTLAGLLRDPLIRLVMRSDNVSEEDFSGLWMRAQECVLAREVPADRLGLALHAEG
jgi:hypothetical protein